MKRWGIPLIFLAQVLASGPLISGPQPLHLCALPEDPIEDEAALARFKMTVQEEYSRYFNDLNSYLLCLQKSQADVIARSRFWHDRYIELFETPEADGALRLDDAFP
ncbi:hypothetical protein MR829_21130 [Paracoccus versutus]|uniref:hypothetical protein n=1 Tax=Paracoccus versutus TaxID=34007 RepID=UPI001FB65C71|nr:hypothetical protein [Paracoccus versutus]MCJ1902849.1 hypothetical protein [Paracoccus versutus]